MKITLNLNFYNNLDLVEEKKVFGKIEQYEDNKRIVLIIPKEEIPKHSSIECWVDTEK